MSWASVAQPRQRRAARARRTSRGWREGALARPELIGLLGAAAFLNLWGLRVNGWANTYYAAAVRSMTTSWHDFLYASLDKSGLMTVDKPPLSLWVQALSARVFGFHPLSILVPQALMGVAAVALTYDLTRRRFGRGAGFLAGFVLTTTPVAVAVSRHNNPDELLVLCCVAALWCALRALEDGRTRWFVLTGVCIGLGFETKMGVALLVVPGIAVAWLWVAPHDRLKTLRSCVAGAVAALTVGGAWPLLVALTPATARPWISGTSDNSVLSLIFGYNGLGRIAGQTGGPGGGGPGGGGTMFGGPTGPLRLLQTGLGDQAGWLLGSAMVVLGGLLLLSRLRRHDPRTGWLLIVGGAFVCAALTFSFAGGIFHPYYVSLLAPFAAAFVGAGVGSIASPRLLVAAALAAGAITELVVLQELNGQLSWATPLVIAVPTAGAGLLLTVRGKPRTQAALLAVGIAALLAAPTTWAAETLGHATSATFPTGGPASTAQLGGPGGGPGGRASRGAAPGGGAPPGGAPPGGAGLPGPLAGLAGGAPGGTAFGHSLLGPGHPGFGPPGFGPPGPGGADVTALKMVANYVRAHGGGTVGVESQSSAAAAILATDVEFAGLGGFSGRESSVTVAWLADQVARGRLRWIVVDRQQSARLPGDTRTGSQSAMDAVGRTCSAVRLSTTTSTTMVALFDCQGRGRALRAAAMSG